MGDLERMGKELKCPICWSLFDSAVSLTCNHLFCNSCIVKSMKSAFACPVCKIPFTRREVRPAPHMDNLVSIYKNMEVASGINIFVTQNVSQGKLSDVEKQCEGNADSGKVEAGGSHKGHVQEKKTRKIKKVKKTVQTNMESSGSGFAKPSFPAKKRVLVPQNILSETPMKNLKLGDSLNEFNKEKEGVEKVSVMESERPLQIEKSVPVLSPFFWLREEKDGETLSQPADEDQIIDCSTPNPPSFSDLKDSDDEHTSNVAPFDERQHQISVNLFDSEMFEWTQRPCSPELFSSPSKMQVMDTYEDDENEDELVAASQELDANLSSANADDNKFENPKGNKTADVLLPSLSPVIRSSVDINGKMKSRKRGRKVAASQELDANLSSANADDNKFENPKGNKTADVLPPSVSPVIRSSVDINGKMKSRKRGRKVATSQELDANLSSANADDNKFENPNGNKTADVLPPSVSPVIRSSVDINGKMKSRKRGRKARVNIRQEQIVEAKNSIDGMHVDGNISLEVTQEQALDYKPKSSNLEKASRRGKRVCFNTSSIPTSVSACTAPDTSGVLSIGQMKMVPNSYTSLCKQENEKHCPLEFAGKSQKIRPGKQNMDQPNEFASFDSSIFSLQTNSNVNTSKSKQSQNTFSRKSMSGSRKLRNTKRSKFSSECTSITKSAEETLPNESIHQGPHVRDLNDASKEKHCSLTDKTVLRKCESLVKSYQCLFCLSSEESEVSGPMVHYLDGKPVPADYEGGFKVTHCHRNCTEWAPNVYFDGDNAINLEAEISRSRRIRCSFCGLKGAALGCYEKSCRRSFHVPCAKWTSLCRWDTQNFVMLCPLHASSMLPCEGSGSQERSKKGPGRDGKNHGPSLDTTRQTRADHRSYKKIVLCCSALSVQEKEIVSKFESVSKVTVLKNWDSSVTHVIASTEENGACRRTLKVLMGILEGKWILKVEWIKACMKEMNPVGEERYEINVDVHGIRDGPRLGRLRVLNKQPKLFDGYKFYFMGDFIPSYKGYLQDLVVAAGGIILHRKPVSGDQKSMLLDTHPYQTLIIYSLELPDKCKPSNTDTICRQRCHDAEVLASSTGSKVATNTWILNSIAACKLQCLTQ
ncbi:hypothetical protein PHAVU_006G167200 [Phaseolus vulgaris]|uniref:Uncharacterized protein n=1 Tax=Phaseolus vulgaris TaxID=3885 RepID=V7BPN4_PHAVU|nr:hypothetical protein PHAVU_006G167200g [Phaseolus vulgaris]ESW19932.1 hypothetical protein PHAVU_006G167200g [Phaseolus vulgaris]